MNVPSAEFLVFQRHRRGAAEYRPRGVVAPGGDAGRELRIPGKLLIGSPRLAAVRRFHGVWLRRRFTDAKRVAFRTAAVSPVVYPDHRRLRLAQALYHSPGGIVPAVPIRGHRPVLRVLSGAAPDHRCAKRHAARPGQPGILSQLHAQLHQPGLRPDPALPGLPPDGLGRTQGDRHQRRRQRRPTDHCRPLQGRDPVGPDADGPNVGMARADPGSTADAPRDPRRGHRRHLSGVSVLQLFRLHRRRHRRRPVSRPVPAGEFRPPVRGGELPGFLEPLAHHLVDVVEDLRVHAAADIAGAPFSLAARRAGLRRAGVFRHILPGRTSGMGGPRNSWCSASCRGSAWQRTNCIKLP